MKFFGLAVFFRSQNDPGSSLPAKVMNVSVYILPKRRYSAETLPDAYAVSNEERD